MLSVAAKPKRTWVESHHEFVSTEDYSQHVGYLIYCRTAPRWGRLSGRAQALNLRGKDNSANCTLSLKAKETLNSFMLPPSITSRKHTSSTMLLLLRKTGLPLRARRLQKTLKMLYYFHLLIDWNQLLEGKAHSSVNHHTHSSKGW